jgi:hypothetical protein
LFLTRTIKSSPFGPKWTQDAPRPVVAEALSD